ncbi:MAG: hypothetical protein ACD_79C00281G0003 [uncultured bacterium]|nr:MAG: hypothetical protein ACD_79C00281G0003 [uncultured bacterium]
MGFLLDNKTIVVTGGTGSLGKVLTKRLLSGKNGKPKKIIIFSRDEAKQHFMRLEYQQKAKATDEIIYKNFEQLLEFRIGDIRSYSSVCSVLKHADVVINAAALKQVPTCEYFPYEAVQTNITGAENIVKAIHDNDYPVKIVVGVSTDKACKPINVMGMTKALQERVFITANLTNPNTRFVCVRYGNVLASRGSVIPLFHQQIQNGGPLTITDPNMTRFLMPLEKAVDTILKAIEEANKGETYIPRISTANMLDVAKVLIDKRNIKIEITGLRPGEKMYEELISYEESCRTVKRGEYFAIKPMLPELCKKEKTKTLNKEFTSNDSLMSLNEIRELFEANKLLIGQNIVEEGEFLR